MSENNQYKSSHGFSEILFASYLLILASILLYGRVHTFKGFFQLRADDIEARQKNKSGQRRCFGWIRRQYELTEDELLAYCGLDTLTFFRFLQVGRKFLFLVVVASLVLIPVYYSEKMKNKESSSMRILGLYAITLTDVAKNDVRLWAPVVASYVFCGYMMYLLWVEYTEYVRRRHEVLSSIDSPQYSILINDVPPALRDNTRLRQYMEQFFPGQVKDVQVDVECELIENWIEKKRQLQLKLDYALAKYEKTGRRPHHVQGRSWFRLMLGYKNFRGYRVDSIEYYQQSLATVNQVLERGSVRIQQHRDMAKGTVGRSSRELFEDIEENDTMDCNHAQGVLVNGNDQGQRKLPLFSPESAKLRHHSNLNYGSIQRDVQSSSGESACLVRRSAFVSFTSLTACHVLQQTVQSRHPARMSILAAPCIDDVDWDSIGLGFRTRALWRLISACVTAIIVLFWTIPTTLVASLASVDSLRHTVPFLNRLLREYPALTTLCSALSPLALLALNSFATYILAFLSEREAHPSFTEVRASLFTKLAYFQLIQIFFVTVIAGTLLDTMEHILNSPKELIVMLGRSIPHQSKFFSSYILTLMGVSLPLELFRVVPLTKAALYKMCVPKRIQVKKEASSYGLAPYDYLETFDPTRILADCFLVMLVSLTFAPIAPYACTVFATFFSLVDLVYRRNALYVYKSSWFAMGAYWPCLFKFMVVAMVISQLTMLGLLLLKEAVPHFACTLLLILIICLYYHYMTILYGPLAKYLPLAECLERDETRKAHGDTSQFDFLNGVYRPPALAETTEAEG
uniref:Uncharacterized protein AlNc14C12G1477 n=1 Tax=Albugo laibachii Nc14 TaxID=890382 RepID=F0W3A0_9STRA|nr:conserved hypothetical protein [Albugo laibachii Nc14]|eukprot:CCA15543.1 conserved hypothetical protein [Albugo laibachii Nc14]